MHARRLLTNLSDAVGFPFLSRPTGSFFLTLIYALKHLLRCFHPHNNTEHYADELRVESVPITKQTWRAFRSERMETAGSVRG